MFTALPRVPLLPIIYACSRCEEFWTTSENAVPRRHCHFTTSVSSSPRACNCTAKITGSPVGLRRNNNIIIEFFNISVRCMHNICILMLLLHAMMMIDSSSADRENRLSCSLRSDRWSSRRGRYCV